MKRRVPGLIKRIIAALSSKTNELRTRIMIFFLLHRNQCLLLDKFQTFVPGRHAHRNAQSLRCGKEKNEDNDDEGSHVDCPRGRGGEEESFVMYMNTEPAMTMETSTVVDPTTKQVFSYIQESTPEDSCIDLTHTLFKESEEEMKKLIDNEDVASINTMVNFWEDIEDDGRLNEEEAGEEDIDHAADVFIERFRRQIQLQKQLSLRERHCSSSTQMLQHN